MIILSTVVLVIISCMVVNAEELAFEAELNFDVYTNSPPWLTLTWYSNYSKLFYGIFGYNRPAVGNTAYYVTSPDGINWTNHTRLFFPDSGSAWDVTSGRWDIYIEPNGRYIHGAMIKTATSPNAIYYFKRELFPNGTLGTCGLGTRQPELVAQTTFGAFGEANKYIDIYLDNESYPYITFTTLSGGFESGHLLAGNNPIPSNGTWNEGDYTYTEYQAQFGNLWDDQWKCTVTGVSDGVTETGFGRGVHWMETHESSLASNKEISSSAKNFYNGSGWVSFDDSAGSAMWDVEGGDWADNAWDIVAIGNITLIVKQTEQENTPDRIQLSYGTKIGGGDWSDNKKIVSFEVLGDGGAQIFNPMIGVDYNRSVVIVFGLHKPDGNDTVWYRKGIIGFDGIMTWLTNITEWESWKQNGAWDFNDYSSGSAEPLGANVPLSMIYQDDFDKEILHDYIFTENNGELPLPAMAHFNTSLYNDFDGVGLKDDDWLFEGEIYRFETFAIGADEFFINFTDGQHEIKFRFDASDEQLYITAGERFVIGEIHTNYTLLSTGVQIFSWRFVPDINIVDIENTTV
jgi:hypothetical protein